MAKKVVATLKTAGAGKDFAKAYRAVKTAKGSYSFKSEIIPNEEVKTHFKK
ncbi:MAG: DUF4295 domain-containing protein [Sphingobacteriales bacterium]|jgi:hypothetical protein|nr:DUF4295 domain-containing protein [Sphingobacteriales bacterium]MDP3928247.1 DUF4295 family protein [Bacteroidota bacterium]